MNRKNKFVLIIVIAASILLALLKYKNLILFSNEELINIIYIAIILCAVVITVINSNISIINILKYIGIWLLIIGALLTGYSYKNDVKKIFSKVYANLIPGTVIEKGQNSITIIANQSGHFFVNTITDNTNVKFLVDTGATDVALTRNDAKRLGINLNNLTYNKKVSTANGNAWSAPIKLKYIKIGSIVIFNVSASVASDNGLSTSLLGMSFLNRLKSYRVYNDTLTMFGE